jgi:hypothetical protein
MSFSGKKGCFYVKSRYFGHFSLKTTTSTFRSRVDHFDCIWVNSLQNNGTIKGILGPQRSKRDLVNFDQKTTIFGHFWSKPSKTALVLTGPFRVYMG